MTPYADIFPIFILCSNALSYTVVLLKSLLLIKHIFLQIYDFFPNDRGCIMHFLHGICDTKTDADGTVNPFSVEPHCGQYRAEGLSLIHI